MLQDRFVDVDGVKIRFQEREGTGPAVLMTHGIGESLEFWQRQFDGLDADLRLIAWDMPGHGLSGLSNQPLGPESLASFGWRFLDRIGVGQVHLIGNSLGASVSLRMAGLSSTRVETLLLANAASLGRENPLPFRLMTLPVLGGLMMRPGPMAIKQQIQAIVSNPSAIDDALLAAITRNVHKPGGSNAFLATLRLMGGLGGQSKRLVAQSHELLSLLKIPVLFVHGREDAVIPVGHSIAAAGLAPGSSVSILEDCGHTPQVEQPKAFNQLVSQLVFHPR